MRIVIAIRDLAGLGGAQTFVLTIAEQLARLGHIVSIYAVQVGFAADVAKSRAIEVLRTADLPREGVDATISLDKAMAIDLALLYPEATRLYAMHNSSDAWLPPPAPGIVAATVAPNDRLAALASSCTGAGEIVRIQQPIDLSRFTPRGCWPRTEPTRVLLIGNYFNTPAQRADQIRSAWATPGLVWTRIGFPNAASDVAEKMAETDIVVGYGRSILEAMACGRAAYVHEHSGSDGWVTAETYDRMEADGFSGMSIRTTPSLDQLRKDLTLYDPSMGRLGHDLARRHDARLIAALLVTLIDRLGKPVTRHDPMALRALANLAEGRLRADHDNSALRVEVWTLRLELRKRRLDRRVRSLLSRVGAIARRLLISGWAKAIRRAIKIT
jgi:hypothetical protein